MFGKGGKLGYIDPSDYPYRVKIQRMVIEKNAFSEPVETVDSSFTVWAGFEPRKGSEWPDLGGDKLAGEKRQAISLALFRVPVGCQEIDSATHQIVFQGKTWDIRNAVKFPIGLPVEWRLEAQSIS